ncbi:MAG: isocitrate/isopropylmalate dehydrogenase family protein [Dehalococcoidia bacterium]|nr:isocitrate/isopropylmalate dehydrogenase family protein [Dehalococcoidia bacterium]
MESHNITLIPGDGIGPELTDATKRVLEATGVKFNWDIVHAGTDVMAEYGTPLPQHVLESLRKNKVALKGPLTTPVGSGFRSVNVALRKELELYCCLRPCKSYAGTPTLYNDVDIVVMRENMEDLYAGIEFEKGSADAGRLISFLGELGANVRPDSGISIKPLSEFGCRRIVRFAFEYARANKRRKVTAVHKANIMKFSDGLFLAISRDIAQSYPEIEFEDRIVDNMTMQLVKKPQQFDVLVCPNLYGDIISDLCAGLVGGLGVAPGANLGDGIALFEPTHGSAPKYKGINKANPMAMMLSGVLMLRHINETAAADKVEKSIAAVIAGGQNVTYDLKRDGEQGNAIGTAQVADAIIDVMHKMP